MNRPRFSRSRESDSWKECRLSRLLRAVGQYVAGVVLLALPTANAGAWPTSFQPAVWLDQPWGQALLIGTALTGLALSGWVLLGRFRRRSSSRPRHIPDLWPELVRRTASARTLDELLRSAAQVLTDSLHADCTWVGKFSIQEDRWVPIGASGPGCHDSATLDAPSGLHALLRTVAFARKPAILPEPLETQRKNRARHWLVVPIGDHHRTLAAIAISRPGLRADDAHLLTAMEPVREFLSRSVGDLVSLAASAMYQASVRAGDALAQELFRCTTIESALDKIIEFIHPICTVDYFSISRIDPRSHQEIRWSALVEGNRLVERRYPILSGSGGSVLGPNLRQPSINHDLQNDRLLTDSVEARLGMRSRLTVPLVWGGKITGVLTVAHRQPRRFDDVTLIRLQPPARALAGWLQVRQTETLAGRMDRYLDVLDRLEHVDVEDRDTVTGLLRQAMDVTAVRLFRYDPADESFSLAGSSFARPVGERGGLRLQAPAERLPWLRFAARGEHPCLVDQNDPERFMSAEESRLAMLEQFKTGLLMSVRRDGRSLGVVSAIEMRHPARRRFEGADYLFMRCAASRLAGVLSRTEPATRQAAEQPALQPIAPLLAGPLTTIYGSIDLIRQNTQGLDERSNRYLHNIERAAERIKEYGYQLETVAPPQV